MRMSLLPVVLATLLAFGVTAHAADQEESAKLAAAVLARTAAPSQGASESSPHLSFSIDRPDETSTTFTATIPLVPGEPSLVTRLVTLGAFIRQHPDAIRFGDFHGVILGWAKHPKGPAKQAFSIDRGFIPDVHEGTVLGISLTVKSFPSQ